MSIFVTVDYSFKKSIYPLVVSVSGSPLANLTSLDLSKNQIEDVTSENAEDFPNLEELYLSGNSIYYFDSEIFGRLKKLENLMLEDNLLGHFELGTARQLKMLWLKGTAFEFGMHLN